jgi:hypothetical protein
MSREQYGFAKKGFLQMLGLVTTTTLKESNWNKKRKMRRIRVSGKK